METTIIIGKMGVRSEGDLEGKDVKYLAAPLAVLAATPERHPRDPVAAYLRTLAPAGRVTVANRLAAVARELDAAPVASPQR